MNNFITFSDKNVMTHRKVKSKSEQVMVSSNLCPVVLISNDFYEAIKWKYVNGQIHIIRKSKLQETLCLRHKSIAELEDLI